MHETIRKLREQNNYSQTGVAQLLQISRQMYVKYENGEVEPPVKIIRQLCSLYQVSYNFIIDDVMRTLSTQEKTDKSHTTYPEISEKISMAASPVLNYGAHLPYKHKSTQSFESVVEAIRTLSADQFSAVLAFVNYLKDQIQPVDTISDSKRKGSIIPPRASKDSFFDLAGKINLDADEITSFRENSLI